MVTIRSIRDESERDRLHVRELIWEFLQWLHARISKEFGETIDIEAMLAQDMAELQMYLPPDGALLLAVDGEEVVGLVCLRAIAADVGEVKRMYVREAYRGRAIGRRLLNGIIAQAKARGYTTLRLDSALFMTEARSLYRSTGFREIEPYSESGIPPELHQYAVFMELNL